MYLRGGAGFYFKFSRGDLFILFYFILFTRGCLIRTGEFAGRGLFQYAGAGKFAGRGLVHLRGGVCGGLFARGDFFTRRRRRV